MSKRLIVVGAGLGGLSVALRAVSAGWNVQIFERSSAPGGKMNRLQADGFTFDTGPSLLTLPHIFQELFDSCGVGTERLKLRRLMPLTAYLFPDRLRIEYPDVLPNVAKTIEQYEPDRGIGFWTLMATAAKLYELSTRTFFQTAPREIPTLREVQQLLVALRWLPLRNAWGNYAHTVERLLGSDYWRRIFLRYPTYVGSSPYRSPATLLVIPYLEFAQGGWYVEGGLYRIIEIIVEALKERGAALHTNTPVVELLHRNGHIKGVKLDSGDRIDADVVVYNGDVSAADQLLGLPLRWKQMPTRSMSGVVFLVGLRRRLPEWVHHHTIVFSRDYRREFAEIFESSAFPSEPTVYVNVTSKTDPTTAPAGCEAVFLMANAPAVTGRNSWQKSEEMLWERIQRVLDRHGMAIAETDIAVRELWTPERFEHEYGMPEGAIYGFASHSYRTAFLRPSLRDRRIGGLYYVGGSTHPGGGTPMVVLSSRLVWKLIQRYEVDS